MNGATLPVRSSPKDIQVIMIMSKVVDPMRRLSILAFFLNFFVTQSTLANLKSFELGFDTKIGVAAIEDATKEEYTPSLLFGMGGDAGIPLNAANFIRFSIFCMKPLNMTEDGTEQVRVKRSTLIVNPLIQYEHRFRKLALVCGIGPSLGIVTTVFSLYDLGMPAATSDDSQFYFPNKKRTLQSIERGIELGVVLSTGLALDMGEIWGIESDFFILSFNTEVVRRGRRNEIFGWGAIIIRPASLLKN